MSSQPAIDFLPLCRWCGLMILELKEVEVRDDGSTVAVCECIRCHRRTAIVHS